MTTTEVKEALPLPSESWKTQRSVRVILNICGGTRRGWERQTDSRERSVCGKAGAVISAKISESALVLNTLYFEVPHVGSRSSRDQPPPASLPFTPPPTSHLHCDINWNEGAIESTAPVPRLPGFQHHFIDGPSHTILRYCQCCNHDELEPEQHAETPCWTRNRNLRGTRPLAAPTVSCRMSLFISSFHLDTESCHF